MALSRRQFLAALGATTFAAPRLLAEVRKSSLPVRSCAWMNELSPKTIAIVGDVQRTGIAELSFMGRRQNDIEREAILKAIAADKPDMLLMLGDQVSTGDDADWEYFDSIMKDINDAQIPVRSIVGNHDYGDNRSRCMKLYNDRFPHCEEVHSMVRLGSIGLVTVNTNFDQLRPNEIREQAEDYRKWLDELDADPLIRGVIVAAHHPPYTNSDLGRNREVEEMFARPFLSNRKTRLFLSGHVHSYERFASGDKTFVISGGGGGPRRTIDNSSSRSFQNDAYRTGTLRPFHYIKMSIADDALKADVMMMQKGKFVVGDRFKIGLYT